LKYTTIEITLTDARFVIDCIDALLRISKDPRPVWGGSRKTIRIIRDRLKSKIEEARS